MKYKVGDRVIIKSWKEMKEEYGVNSSISIQAPPDKYSFVCSMEEDLNKNFPNRILTIKEIKEKSNYYNMEEISAAWEEYMIKCLSPQIIPLFPTNKRFQLMDLE